MSSHLLHPLKLYINSLQSSLQGLLNNREKCYLYFFLLQFIPLWSRAEQIQYSIFQVWSRNKLHMGLIIKCSELNACNFQQKVSVVSWNFGTILGNTLVHWVEGVESSKILILWYFLQSEPMHNLFSNKKPVNWLIVFILSTQS